MITDIKIDFISHKCRTKLKLYEHWGAIMVRNQLWYNYYVLNLVWVKFSIRLTTKHEVNPNQTNKSFRLFGSGNTTQINNIQPTPNRDYRKATVDEVRELLKLIDSDININELKDRVDIVNGMYFYGDVQITSNVSLHQALYC